MRLTRVIALLFAALAQTGCQSAGNLIQAPLNMMGRMIGAVGRTLHVASDDHGAHSPVTLDDREVREAVAAMGKPSAMQDVAAPQLVQR
jgi:hypothetical protein